MKGRQFIPQCLIIALALIFPTGTLPAATRAQSDAPVAPILSQSAQTLPTPWFTNVTDEVGLAGVTGFRVSIADVNGDGYPDLLLHQVPESLPSGCATCKDQALYLNVKGGTPDDSHNRQFLDYTAESGIRASRRETTDRRSNLAVFADVDNDGDLDMFSGLYAHRLDQYTDNNDRNDLFLNDGNGHFELASNSPFHTEPLHNTAGAVFLDYNNDGHIDLFIGNWYGESGLTDDQLYQGHGDGRFTNVTDAAGIGAISTCVYAVSAADWNNDGFTDLFAPSYSHQVSGSTPIHWRNNGDGTFTQVQDTTHYSDYRGYGSGKASFGSMPRDFDNDGDTDLCEIITHGWGDGSTGVHSTVLVNNDNTFSWDFYRVSGREGYDRDLGHHGDHHASWFDIENDGLADFALTESGASYDNNGLYLFQQAADNTFHHVTPEAGLDGINADDLPSHNVIALDYDLDGDEDLLIGFDSATEGIQLWRNEVGTQNNWLTISLEGAGIPGHSNKSAIGARVEVTAGDKTYTREVYAGNGHFGPQAPLALTFGLDEATRVDRIKVHWPNERRTSTELHNVSANQFINIREPIAPTVKVAITRFTQIDEPDPWPFGDGEYYAAVTIDGELAQSGIVEGTDFEPPDWVFTKVVDRCLDSIPVNVRIMDQDVAVDDNIDINPIDGVTDLRLSLDMKTGRWSGDVAFPTRSAEGNGDTARGRVYFDISLERPPGKIVVNNDEWTLSDQGFAKTPAEAAQFAQNVASWFTSGCTGEFLAYSVPFGENNGLVGTQLTIAMDAAHHTWTVLSTPRSFSLDDLLPYDGIFLAGTPVHRGYEAPDHQVLIDYVKAGGNVYLSGGTDMSNPRDEAQQWNRFLRACGLEFVETDRQNDVDGVLEFSSSHPIFAGVHRLYQRDGNSIREVVPVEPEGDAAILVHSRQHEGLYAVCTIGAQVESAPTAIDLLSFTARPSADRVLLSWETGSEVDNAGFNVWRSESEDGEYVQINEALIPAEGDAASSARYRYVDDDVTRGVTYYYKLEDVDIHGVSTFHWPVSATPGPGGRIVSPSGQK